MRSTGSTHPGSKLSLWALLTLGAAAQSAAATLEIAVADERGRPIERVVVYATPTRPSPRAMTPVPTASMDQQEHRFVPHILVVQTGTSVMFPNTDDVSHHVYSFSPTKPFELPLYKGNLYPPVVFDQPGIVVLGCNIHDSMLGYIRVVDTPYFALTNEQGVAQIGRVPMGDYTLEAWTPRARPAGLPSAQPITITAADVVTAELHVTGRLAPDHDSEHGASSLSWDRY